MCLLAVMSHLGQSLIAPERCQETVVCTFHAAVFWKYSRLKLLINGESKEPFVLSYFSSALLCLNRCFFTDCNVFLTFKLSCVQKGRSDMAA